MGTCPGLETHVMSDTGSHLAKRFYQGKSLKPGGGGKFERLKDKLAAKGADNPSALSAWLGRKKYGASQMAKWSAAGRKG